MVEPKLMSARICPGCDQLKVRESFYRSNHTIHGMDTYCKHCRFLKHQKWRLANLKHCSAQQKRWRDNNPDAQRDYDLRRHYQMTADGYANLLSQQGGKCAICRTTEPNGRGLFHVDHCHDNGTIRGLLCHGCNVGIGHFKHDPKLLQLAIEYLSIQPKVTNRR